MIQLYNIIEFTQELIGGANKPFIVRVSDNNNNYVGQYVVKIFDKKRIEQDNYVGKEFFCSTLAINLDIKTPELVLLKLHKEIENIPPIISDKLENYPFNVFLGSKYIESANQFSPSFTSKELSEFDIETIFAFDALIVNPDRSRIKPNLIIKKDDIYVIDHEYALGQCKKENEINMSLSQSVLIGSSDNKKHIFFDYLKRKKSEINFDTFEFYIENLNVNFFDKTNDQLEDFGYKIEYLENIKSYISHIKTKKSIFVNSIREVLN